MKNEFVHGHFNGIQSFDLLPSRNFLATTGRHDGAVFLWRFAENFVEKAPVFPKQIFESFFYFVQLQGSPPFHIEPFISLPLIVDFLRSLGFFISKRQIKELFDEETLRNSVSDPRLIKIDFPQLIEIFFNHFYEKRIDETTICNELFDELVPLNSTKIDFRSFVELLVSFDSQFLFSIKNRLTFLVSR